jgi:hypothetical protein
VLSGTLGLWLLLAVAIGITLSRPRVARDPEVRRRCVVALACALVAQCAHFAEELVTGFYGRFPALLGLAPWSATFFVAFNLAWIVLWTLSIVGVRRGFVPALAPAWFLALALVLNGIAHPLLAWREGGYFPGLATAPIVLPFGLLACRRLAVLTRPAAQAA